MTAAIGAHTRLLAVLGDPVGHSLSPVIHNAAMQEAGLDGVYVALRCSDERLPGLLRGLAEADGGGNVTLPHKQAAARVVDEPTDAVRRTGACNTFWNEDGALHGDNTDVHGFRAALAALLPDGVWGRRVLLLGAGGSARAAMPVLLDEGVEQLVLLNRSAERARALAGRAGDPRVRVVEGPGSLADQPFDLLVNATKVGLDPSDPLPIPLEDGALVGAVLDLVYLSQGETSLVSRARSLGIPAADGAEMLLYQGAAAFERWWKREAPLDVMRRALMEARRLP